jgi:hypothetical protein
LHCQFGDLSEDTPAKFHAIRGLGILLLEPCFYSNLTMCRFLQHVHDNFNIWLKVQDNPEKARAQVQEFANLGVLKSGVSVVPEAERHQIETSNVEMALSQMKQRTSEASSSYTQESDSGTQKERTAFETRVEEEKVNAAMTTILMVAFKYESYAYREICRRFCLPNSDDPDIVTFRNRCKEAGIPPQWMDVKLWEIVPVTPLGMGNPTIAITMAEQLMAQRGAFNPTAQAEILHEFVLATTKDPRKAARWAPIAGKPQQSDATREAIGLFATLLIAAPGSVPPPQNNYVDQIEVLMPLLAGKIMLYTKRNNMADAEEAQGLMNVSGYIGQAIQALGQDPQQRQKVKQYGDSMGKLSNEIKALAQRGAEAAKKQAAQNGNGQAAEAQAKMQADKAQTAQSMAHKEQEFKASERRKDAEHRAEQRRKDAEAYAGTQRKEFESMASAHNNRLKSFKEPKGE